MSRATIWAAAAVLALLLALGVRAAGDLALSSWRVASGGGASQGGTYALTGTIGQPEAGALSGDTYALSGGFLAGDGPGSRVFVPAVNR